MDMFQQYFSLRWNNYTTKIVNAFQTLWNENDFVDVTIACGDQCFPAHKMVISACSPIFRSVLKVNQSPHPVIILTDVDPWYMRKLLEFMYNGEISIEQSHLNLLLHTADRLKVRGLTQTLDSTPLRHELSKEESADLAVKEEVLFPEEAEDSCTSGPEVKCTSLQGGEGDSYCPLNSHIGCIDPIIDDENSSVHLKSAVDEADGLRSHTDEMEESSIYPQRSVVGRNGRNKSESTSWSRPLPRFSEDIHPFLYGSLTSEDERKEMEKKFKAEVIQYLNKNNLITSTNTGVLHWQYFNLGKAIYVQYPNIQWSKPKLKAHVNRRNPPVPWSAVIKSISKLRKDLRKKNKKTSYKSCTHEEEDRKASSDFLSEDKTDCAFTES